MIVWLASYPKSGNTWLRSLLASYYFSKEGEFNFKLLEKIRQFPSPDDFVNDNELYTTIESTSKYWISKQVNMNLDKRLKLLKTHNAICKINGNPFTDTKNTLGAIYIVRDPRNIVTSLANHYQIDQNKALDFMRNETRYIYEKRGDRFLGFSPLFSWSKHVDSWISCKSFPILTIRYEDLHQETFQTLKKVVDFIKTISKSKNSFNRDKAKQSIKSCEFDKLKKLEIKEGFQEAVMKKDKSDKVKFFNLGQENDYKKILNQNLIIEMNNLYKKEILKFNYEK
jgi:hypothetical protein